MIDGAELAALAALHDRLNASGLPWRLTSVPEADGGSFWYRCEVRLEEKMVVDVSAPKLRELVTKLSRALIAAATGAPPQPMGQS